MTKRDHWTRCSWCWTPLNRWPDTLIWHQGHPYCSEKCRAGELPDTAESGSPALQPQLEGFA